MDDRSRRRLERAAGGLMIGFRMGSEAVQAASQAKLNAFVHVGTDDMVTLPMLEEVQIAELVSNWVLPSLKVPVAVN